jgi:hypothetical protein
MIDELCFWSLIESAWPTTEQARVLRQMAFSGELEESDELYSVQKQVLANLSMELDKLDADELLTFDRILERKLYDIDRADINEYTGGSNDGFLYCRGFIVSMGRDYYEAVQSDPSRAIMNVELEELCYQSYWLYEEKYGPMPPSEISRETGANAERWNQQS